LSRARLWLPKALHMTCERIWDTSGLEGVVRDWAWMSGRAPRRIAITVAPWRKISAEMNAHEIE
jgi:hypothetical protein